MSRRRCVPVRAGLALRVRQSLAAAESRNEPGARDLARWVSSCVALPVIVPRVPSDSVTVTREGVRVWARRWPCAGFPDAPVTFGYDDEDVCDISGRGWDDCDSDAVGPLADDARELRDMVRELRLLPTRLLARRCACGREMVGAGDVDDYGAVHLDGTPGGEWEVVHSADQCVSIRPDDGAPRVWTRNPERSAKVGTVEFVPSVPVWARGYLSGGVR